MGNIRTYVHRHWLSVLVVFVSWLALLPVVVMVALWWSSIMVVVILVLWWSVVLEVTGELPCMSFKCGWS